LTLLQDSHSLKEKLTSQTSNVSPIFKPELKNATRTSKKQRKISWKLKNPWGSLQTNNVT